MDDKEKDRMKRFESALNDPIPPLVLGASRSSAEPGDDQQTVASLIEKVRAQVKIIHGLCDEVDAMITVSEEHARRAADNLMDLIKRVK
jgi:hypothetical protein